MKNWIDIIRPNDYFELIDLNRENVIPTDFHFGSNIVRTKYDSMFDIRTIPDGFTGVPPSLAFYTPSYQNVDENGLPHGVKPAAAQRYGNVTFLWGHYRHSHTADLVASVNGDVSIMEIDDFSFIPHREDGFPAVIEVIDLYKHFNHGVLHRVGSHPAIKAGNVIATWMIEGNNKRVDGPCTITIDNYQEFWKNGVYHGYKEENFYLSWNLRNSSIVEASTGVLVTPRTPGDIVNPHIADLNTFLDTLHGETNIFSNTYFTDPQDEICFGAEFL